MLRWLGNDVIFYFLWTGCYNPYVYFLSFLFFSSISFGVQPRYRRMNAEMPRDLRLFVFFKLFL